jgi:small subunit ribosomal protein S17e
MAVKPKYVKEISRHILRKYSEDVSKDFEVNKSIVDDTTNIESKEVRNRVAGYLCSIKKQSEYDDN